MIEDNFQAAAIIVKLLALLDLVVELVILLCEVYKLHQLRKQSLGVAVVLSEVNKRKEFSKKYSKVAVTGTTLSLIVFLILSFKLPKFKCLEKQALTQGAVCVDC